MSIDPVKEWQRLSQFYSEMGEEELRELATNFGDLTDTAQQVLQDELKKRGLGNPDNIISDIASQERASHQPSSLPKEYTWKVALCECDSSSEANVVAEALYQAGITHWIETPQKTKPFYPSYPRVMVPADELEQAKKVLSLLPPEDFLKEEPSPLGDFPFPPCPKCGASNPLLESVEPFNTWLCENCGALWTESMGRLDP